MAQMGSVLLTGSRGFTGLHLCRELREAGYRVTGLVREEPEPGEVQAEFSDMDSLAEAIAEVRPDFVIHLAGIAFVAHSDPFEFYRTNLFGTLNLLEALGEAGVLPRKVVLASSSNVYGVTAGSVVGEDAIPAPINHYAMSKLAMEHLARTWLDRLPIIIVRPFNYTGPGQEEKFLIPKIVSHYVRRIPVIRLGNLDVEREFNDVRTIVYAYRVLLEGSDAGYTLNLCTGQGHNLRDVLRLVEEITGHRIGVEVDPALVRSNELPVLVGNPARFLSRVKDAPRFSLEDTLKFMIDRMTHGAA